MGQTLYKIVGPAGEPLNGGSGAWSLPCYHKATAALDGCFRPDHTRVGDGWAAPGDWRTVEGDIVPCANGLHLTTARHIDTWMPPVTKPCVVYRAEVRGEIVEADHKVVVRTARLLPRSRPMPDRTAAARKLDRIMARAARVRDKAVPAPWGAYLSAIGASKLPDGHPGRAYEEIGRQADVRYRATVDKARRAYARAFEVSVLPD